MKLIVNWILSAVALMFVAFVVPGFHVDDIVTALIAAAVIGIINATLGLVLKIFTFPLTVISLGIFWIVINALMLELASAFVPGFHISGFLAAFFGAIVLSLANMVLHWLVPTREERDARRSR
jgi:putative membrane protein